MSLEIGDENLDRAIGLQAADLADGFGKDPGAADVVVIAIDAGDYRELESEPRDGFGDAARLVEIDGLGRPLGTAQKPQRRVQRFPSSMKVAVRWFQHSPMLGQCADSQTVCRSSPRASFFSS